MPWNITKTDRCPTNKPWGVIGGSSGDRLAGCHPSKDAARKQQAALYANEEKTMHANRAKILDVHETRTCAQPFEYRENPADGRIIVEGYASTYEPYDVYGGPDRGGWTEQISERAFDVTLASSPDLMLLVNHEGLPLARTTAGNLAVSRDRRGLRVRALLDPADPDVQRLMPKMKPQANGKAIMDEMSFGFRVKDQIWDDSYTHRTITELSLQKGDVSIVNYGANPTTHVAVADTIDALASLSRDDLIEVRNAVEKSLQYSAPAPGITRAGVISADNLPPAPGDPTNLPYEKDDDDDEPGPPGVEAFTPDNPTITVGQLQAAVSEAADPHGVRSLKKALAEFAAVSLPPTLAP